MISHTIEVRKIADSRTNSSAKKGSVKHPVRKEGVLKAKSLETSGL